MRCRTPLPHSLKPLNAQIRGTPFKPRHAQRQAKAMHQPWQVTRKQLVLQGLGRSRYQNALTAEQCRHQIGVGLANARTRLDHQHIALFNGLRHSQRHAGLARARQKSGFSQGQRPARRKHLRDCIQQLSQTVYLHTNKVSATSHKIADIHFKQPSGR